MLRILAWTLTSTMKYVTYISMDFNINNAPDGLTPANASVAMSHTSKFTAYV